MGTPSSTPLIKSEALKPLTEGLIMNPVGPTAAQVVAANRAQEYIRQHIMAILIDGWKQGVDERERALRAIQKNGWNYNSLFGGPDIPSPVLEERSLLHPMCRTVSTLTGEYANRVRSAQERIMAEHSEYNIMSPTQSFPGLASHIRTLSSLFKFW